MMRGAWVVAASVLVGGITCAPAVPRADTPPNESTAARAGDERPVRHEQAADEDDALWDPVSPEGQRAMGMYFPGNYFRRHDAQDVIDLAGWTRTNAAVIDLKDGSGRVTYETDIEILQDSVVNYLGDAAGLIRTLKEAGIYTIARVTCFADPKLPERHPERAILHFRRNEPWVSWGTGGTWLDPYNRDNHAMIEALAREAEELGFDEVQLDYVRFPVDEGVQYARYPGEDDTTRPDLLIELLRRIDRAIHIPLSVDVFGLAAYREGDPSGLGQDLEAWVDYVEIYSPMLYINAMRTWQVGRPDRARYLVESGVMRLRERLGPRPIIRPYLQAFARGAGHEGFNPRFIARQIFGAGRGGSDGFLMWHPGARYSMFRRAMQGPARRFTPFELDEELVESRGGDE
ncbi:MAG: hypothetical protein CMN31_10235 [Sandaracinus sp.]|nr:hypothetical protein [Myxococcales bacterium]MAT24410.1 hypothetical protein [Sandaracinus sp.]MBJ71702.1 hypothetical protein [Sandaracinus sp.]